jgi:EAL domain-containing protein (putative c-di-GMP-specific phosphodiesterase class I)
VAVNLSARQLERPDLVERVAAALATAHLQPDALHLEITESILMDNIEQSVETLVALRDLGIKISIDDFGTGYSSLSYLKRLPIDTLKIDRSFINGLGTDPDDTKICQAIISLAVTLHMNVLAEGVENETQLRTLADLGCHFGQGFLWSEGVEPTAAARWLGSGDVASVTPA